MTGPTGTICGACGKPVALESMHADGATYSCPCGRTRTTVLSEGKLELGVSEPTSVDAPDDPYLWESGT